MCVCVGGGRGRGYETSAVSFILVRTIELISSAENIFVSPKYSTYAQT